MPTCGLMPRFRNGRCSFQCSRLPRSVSRPWFVVKTLLLPSKVSFHFDVLWILERQERHKIRVMHYVCLCRALHQIALRRVCGNNVAYGVGYAAFQCECDAGKGMA